MLYLYTDSVLFPIEWCTRQLCSSNAILHNITSIAHNYHTNIYPLSYKYRMIVEKNHVNLKQKEN